jgi:uncharacterized integral membrane protein
MKAKLIISIILAGPAVIFIFQNVAGVEFKFFFWTLSMSMAKDDCLEMMASQWVNGWLFKPFGLKMLRSMLSLLGAFKA